MGSDRYLESRDNPGYSQEYVNKLETKLAEAGKELAELKKKLEFVQPTLTEANRIISGVNTLLEYINQEHEGFEFDPAKPLGSLELIRRKLVEQREKINDLECSIYHMDNKLHWAEKKMKPIKVPTVVASGLDYLLEKLNSEYVFAHILNWHNLSIMSRMAFTPEERNSLTEVSKWRKDGNATLFLDLMKYGYEAEKTEREIRNEKLEEVFKGYAWDEYTLEYAMELIEKLYEGEQA